MHRRFLAKRPCSVAIIAGIALTGGIAEGKTTVLNIAREQGWNVCSADELAKEVLEDEVTQSEIGLMLGMPVPLDRAALRDRVVHDSEARRKLNTALHGLVWERIVLEEAELVEIPLLIESCLQGKFRRTWVVACGREQQLSRLETRLGNREAAVRMLATQLPTSVKGAFADRVIRTDLPIADVQNHVVELLHSYRTSN